MTYFMALLILVGAGLVFLAKYITRQRTAPRRAHEDMARSTEQLKRELERSGGEIVKRMGGHVERLESLIAESDRRADSLDAQLTELHTLSQTIDKEIDELRAAEQDARREQQLASQLLGELRAAAAGAAAMRQAVPVPQPAVPLAQQPVPSPAPIERVDAQDFTRVLERSIARDEVRQPSAAPAYVPTATAVHAAAGMAQTMQGRSQAQGLADMQATSVPHMAAGISSVGAPDVQEASQPLPQPSRNDVPTLSDDMPDEPSDSAADAGNNGNGASEGTADSSPDEAPDEEDSTRSAARVRALLLSGWSVEDVARETCMGKGAIELMQEMIRRQLADDGHSA